MSDKILNEGAYISCAETDFSEEEQRLIAKAREACGLSYSPYSNFQVGAAVLLDNDEVLLGANQENSSYPAGLCAERVVLFYASANYSEHKIKKIAVTAKKISENRFVPVTPCGGCRQVILEMEVKQDYPIEVIIQVSENQWVKTKSADVLLPFCFNKHSL